MKASFYRLLFNLIDNHFLSLNDFTTNCATVAGQGGIGSFIYKQTTPTNKEVLVAKYDLDHRNDNIKYSDPDKHDGKHEPNAAPKQAATDVLAANARLAWTTQCPAAEEGGAWGSTARVLA